MKKGIIVLLIAVLVSGFAFADVTKFTGSAQVDYVVGLNKGDEFGFKNSTSTTFKFDFEFASKDVVKDAHETDFWAEIAATGKAGYVDSAYKLDVKITKANIHIKDFVINILGPAGPYDYAKSFTKNSDGDANFDYANVADPQFKFEALHGVEVQYEGYSVSVAQYKSNTAAKTASTTYGDLKYYDKNPSKGDKVYKFVAAPAGAPAGAGYYALETKTNAAAAKETLFIYGGAQTKKFEFAEGMTFQAAANALVKGDKNAEGKYALKKNAGLAASFNYTADKIAAGVAADVEYGQATFNADVLVSGGYDFVSGGIYFGLSKAKDADAEKVLEAFAMAAIPAGDYKINVYVEADRLLRVKNEGKYHFHGDWAGFTVKADTTIDKFTVGAHFDWNQVVDKGGAKKDVKFWGMDFGADVAYKAEKFTVKAGATLIFGERLIIGGDPKIEAYSVKPYASVSTDKVVENCTLSLGWSDARIRLDDKAVISSCDKDNGKITATAKIAF